MNEPFDFDYRPHLRSSWNQARLVVGKKLTDRKIRQYEQRGYYSNEFRQARREAWERKQSKREGNFTLRDGRMIYSPR